MKRVKTKISWAIAVVAVSLVLVWFFSAMGHLQSGNAREGKQQLEDALRKAAAACYAAEGIYPPTLEYLQTHYGIQIDNRRYAVFYEIFADNIMPEITVLDKIT